MIGPQRAAPKSVAAINAETRQMSKVLDVQLRGTGRTQRTIDRVLQAIQDEDIENILVIVGNTSWMGVYRGKVYDAISAAREKNQLWNVPGNTINFDLFTQHTRIQDTNGRHCEIRFCTLEDAGKWSRGVSNLLVLIDHHAVEQILLKEFRGATNITSEGGACLSFV